MKNLTATSTNIIKKMKFQMTVKTVNDTADDNDLILTLLMFGAYPRMQKFDPPSLTITQRADAIKKAMKEVRIARAQRQISDALNIRNGPITDHLHDLPLNSEVLVWRKGPPGRSGK